MTLSSTLTFQKTLGSILCIAAAAALLTPCSALADRYELRLHDRDVYGKYALLEGKVDLSIERLERQLARTSSHRNLAPVLIDLCVAYTVKRDFDKARERCDAAIENGWSLSTAYNNRGVMHVARGDYLAAVDDFEMAIGKRKTQWIKRHLAQATNRVEVIESGAQLAGLSENSQNRIHMRDEPN
jgi:tetratricopeptide (TPR) repeat protein